VFCSEFFFVLAFYLVFDSLMLGTLQIMYILLLFVQISDIVTIFYNLNVISVVLYA